MAETNIRIVQPGANLYLWTRCAKIITINPSAEILERVCNQFANRGLAAAFCREREQIVVFTQNVFPPFEVKQDNWIVQVEDGRKNQQIQFSTSVNDASLLTQLIERHILIQIKQRLNMLTFDSPRIFQDIKPFKTVKDIDVYRRFEVSALPIQSVGVGISVDISTAFLTHKTVAEYFRDNISDHDQRCLQEDFRFLSQRQRGQKGTLLYDLGNKQRKCYFDKFLQGVTCATTGPLNVNGQTYNSLLEYYKHNQPQLNIDPNDSVAMVSFRGMDQPRPVAAKLLRLRVMNDSLPRSLNQIDKIAPEDRVNLINDFWQRLGTDLLGHGKPQVTGYFWQPEDIKTIKLFPPTLLFKDENVLPTPHKRDYKEFQEHYRQRLRLLHKFSCLYAPPSIERTVYFAIPKNAKENLHRRLIMDVTEHLKQLTQTLITPEFVPYETLDQVFPKLNRQYKPGIVVFVFDDEAPETYYKVAHELPNWRVKRITFRELKNKFSQLMYTDNHDHRQHPKADRNWNSFIEMITLDVLQQMDCVPWGLKDELPYDAHLAIDVGRNKKDFALSFLIFHPSFSIRTVVKRKIDSKHETINDVVLHEEIVKLIKKAAEQGAFQTLSSVLVLRDGRECGRELLGINNAKDELIKKEILVESIQIDVVDFHKSIAKKLRLWEKKELNVVEQILEGDGFFLDSRRVVLAMTGAPTRYQGTVDPVMIEARSDNIDMICVTKSVYASTHLNYSNPNVAQRLPLELKRTDDELKRRDSQEVPRRIST
ncbi:hypothetical protein C6501_08090 [Candidatus Poribacteria bacterium]|nr:MAG: hypothetical protein C6501_08090 [Candidatus Poribacteria bacterium]